MNARRATTVAMAVAAAMIAHLVAAKAVRDATFLSAWPVSALPAVVIASAALVLILTPTFSRLLSRVGAVRVVAGGFALSAVAHLLEWWTADHPWVAVAIYFHVACFGSLLLSGFWSAASDLFDTQTAKTSYGWIGAAGTTGGVLGGLAVTQIAATSHAENALLVLAVLHGLSAGGTMLLRTLSAPRPVGTGDATPWWFDRDLLAKVPHLKTLALVVGLGTASAGIADYLLRMHAVERFSSAADLLSFFGRFYLVIQIATMAVQLVASAGLRRMGVGRAMSTLPATVTVMGTLTLLYPVFPAFVLLRGVESVIRGSIFRSAYELIFVPMAPAEKHRSKTLLDVTCDRIGEALGAAIVQLALLTTAGYVAVELLAAMIAMGLAHLWIAGRLDTLYLRVIERRLRAQPDAAPIVVGSETGWTVLNLSAVGPRAELRPSEPTLRRLPVDTDPALRRLTDLRSGDRTRVHRAISDLAHPTAIEIAQVIQLLAWDDVVPAAREVLERHGTHHIGLLTDALLDEDTDFAIRRRVPRILGAWPERRALDGLVAALDDRRFEVRFQCSRALRRLASHHRSISIDSDRVLLIVERELSVPPAVWHGHRLIDAVDRDDDAPQFRTRQGERNLEHVFSLLSLILPSEPLAVALRGLESDEPSLKGVAIEYLSGVLPTAVWTQLRLLIESTPAERQDIPSN